MGLDPGSTPKGKLPPFEVAKALAFEAVIGQVEKHTLMLFFPARGQTQRFPNLVRRAKKVLIIIHREG